MKIFRDTRWICLVCFGVLKDHGRCRLRVSLYNFGKIRSPSWAIVCLWFTHGSRISPSYDPANAFDHVCGAAGDEALVLLGYNHLESSVGRDWRVVSFRLGAEYSILDAKKATCGGSWNPHSRTAFPILSVFSQSARP